MPFVLAVRQCIYGAGLASCFSVVIHVRRIRQVWQVHRRHLKLQTTHDFRLLEIWSLKGGNELNVGENGKKTKLFYMGKCNGTKFIYLGVNLQAMSPSKKHAEVQHLFRCKKNVGGR